MKKPLIVSIIINVVLAIIIGLLIYTRPSDTQELKNKIKELELEATKYLNALKLLDDDFKRLQDSISVRDTTILKLKESITQIREDADERIRGIDTLTTSELQQFFTDRYRSTPRDTISEGGN